MFSLNNFVMKTLNGMMGNYPEFQIREYSLNWYSRGVLSESDLETVEGWFNVPEVCEEDTAEELTNEEAITEDNAE